MEYQAFSRKLSNGHSFAGGSVYDGVFAAPSKLGVQAFSSSVEDYREIFGGSEASPGSSIPFLDVPELNERKISVDVRSSELDYSKIFGGFGDSSFALRYEEISPEPNKRNKSEEARTHAERSSPSEASDSSSWRTANCVLLQEASHQAVNGVKKFNMSYSKVSNGNANGTSGTNGTTHIEQLNVVQGYARLVDEVAPLHKGDGDKPVCSAINDACPENNIGEGIMEGNHFMRPTADVQAAEFRKQTSGGDFEFQSNPSWFKSKSMENSFDKHEVGHGTRPSKLPPSSSLPSVFNLGKHNDSTNVDSPPYFDEDIDTNSVAATSVAALRKAIEEAQARIKIAKESMEKKKAGHRNGVKMTFINGVKHEERKECKIAFTVNRSKKKTSPELCKEADSPLHVYSGTRQQNTAGPCQGTADFEVGEKVPCSKEFYGTTPLKKISSQADHKREEAEVSEIEQFYEVENTGEHWSPTTEVDVSAVPLTGKQNATGSGHVAEDSKVRNFVSSTKGADRETPWKELRSTRVYHEEEKAELVEAAEQFYEVDNVDKHWATMLELEGVKRMQSVDENEWKEKTIAEELSEEPKDCGLSPKPAEEEDNSEQIERRVEILNGMRGESDRGQDGVKLVVDDDVPDHEKNERKRQVALKQGEKEEIVGASYENDKYEEDPIEFQEPVDNDKVLEIRGLEDIRHMETQSRTLACVESERRGEEACSQEKHEEEQSDAHYMEDNEKRFIINKAIKEQTLKASLHKLHLGKKIANILSHDDELEVNEMFDEVGGNKKLLIEDACQGEENPNRQVETCQWVEIGRTGTKIDLRSRDEEKMKGAPGESRNQGTNPGAADNICQQDESDNLNKHQKPNLHAENHETTEASQQSPPCQEDESKSDAFLEISESMNELESIKEKDDMEERDVCETDGFHHGLELTKAMRPVEDTTEDFLDRHDANNIGRIDIKFFKNPNDQPVRQLEIVHDSRERIDELACEMEKVKDNINKSEAAVTQEDDKNNSECFDEQRSVDSVGSKKRAESFDSCEGKGENVEQAQETNMNPFTGKDHEHHEVASVSQSAVENEESCPESLPMQIAETEDNDQAAVNLEENSTDNSLRKEVELAKEHLRKIDEAKQRERERERERIAVERAIREVRERAFAEARERAAAGRAAVGARQRAMADARERVGKGSAEHNDKSIAEKVSKEAKLKAERAAVERATAEARERALEKAMSGKAASEARKQNSIYKGPSSSSTSRYPNSSNHNVSSFTERSDGANCESAQRCKARSERHQRITERAEKALAEKNRRDLLAQKEQAERNRLAETLDIEVRRWSSGKEGNLRALLSTLQYILGPDSGWQAIPLTDIITTTAVKKAYRKATLFVHPDKLQQRGANIQQKYTCEKVFDLLKEAWNKFSIEER